MRGICVQSGLGDIRLLLVAIALAAATGAWAVPVSGKVVDDKGAAVADVFISHYVTLYDARADAGKIIKVEKDGSFKGDIPTTSDGEFLFVAFTKNAELMTLVHKQKLPPTGISGLRVVLQKSVPVTATFACKDLGTNPLPVMTCTPDVYTGPKSDGEKRELMRTFNHSASGGKMSTRLPVGEYKFTIFGQGLKQQVRELTITTGTVKADLGQLEFEQTELGKLVGKDAPAWTVSESRNAGKATQLADYKGKWVLVEFWGNWCPTCRSLMTTLLKMRKDGAEFADKFEIVLLHDATAPTLKEYDAQIAKRDLKKIWGGDLPFPLYFDKSGATITQFGVKAFPTAVMVNPEGKLQFGSSETLANMISAWKRAKARDAAAKKDPKSGAAKKDDPKKEEPKKPDEKKGDSKAQDPNKSSAEKKDDTKEEDDGLPAGQQPPTPFPASRSPGTSPNASTEDWLTPRCR